MSSEFACKCLEVAGIVFNDEPSNVILLKIQFGLFLCIFKTLNLRFKHKVIIIQWEDINRHYQINCRNRSGSDFNFFTIKTDKIGG
jgi:hypothetical protein